MARKPLRRYLVTGLTALLPTLLTLFVFYKLWEFARENMAAPLVRILLPDYADPVIRIPADKIVAGAVVSFILMILIAMLAGIILTSFIGVRIFKAVEGWMLRVPIVSSIYRPIRQVTDFFASDKSQTFRSVVAVEYPRKGIYSIGFVTSSGLKDITTPDGRRMVSIFIPSSPTPFTGYVVLVPETDIIPLPFAIDEAIRFTVSGGVIRPGTEIQEVETASLTTLPSDSDS